MSIIRVHLSPEEVAKINLNAEQRNTPKEARRLKMKYAYDGHTNLEVHQLEITGQYGVSKYLDAPMDWSVRKYGNKTGVHMYASGYSLRVKTATHYPPILKFQSAEDFKSDVAVLCLIQDPTLVEIYGCVSRERFLREHLTQNFGYGPQLTMPSWNMTAIEEFEEEAEQGLRRLAMIGAL